MREVNDVGIGGRRQRMREARQRAFGSIRDEVVVAKSEIGFAGDCRVGTRQRFHVRSLDVALRIANTSRLSAERRREPAAPKRFERPGVSEEDTRLLRESVLDASQTRLELPLVVRAFEERDRREVPEALRRKWRALLAQLRPAPVDELDRVGPLVIQTRTC